MTTTTTNHTLSNQQLGSLIGCSFSMASRLRSGHRLPGADLLASIHRVFDIPFEDLHKARDAGAEAFGVLFRDALATYVASNPPEPE